MEYQTLLESATGHLWKRIGTFPHHGIDLPLSALHSKNSCGIGEFLDLLPMIDWCKSLKLDVIQLLPLNDTGDDPSPYNTLSSCAFNPIYLSLYALPYLDTLPELEKKLKELQVMTGTQRVMYNEVKVQKIYWLRLYFEAVGSRLLKSDAFQKFVEQNSWAVPYALFKVLKDKLDHSFWKLWPEELQNLKKPDYKELLARHEKECSFYLLVQFLAFTQLKIVRDHAVAAGILLKGDIPILISPDSVDVWHHSEFFDMTLAAGAPPNDPYTGDDQQYWGFPLYKWDVLKQSSHTWWRQRLKVASELYDMYRIDHAVGLFRIWAIPVGHPEILGIFIPEDPHLWIPQGKEILEMMVDASPMLPIAEDLGLVPSVVRQCLAELGIPGTKVMRWERLWESDKSFIPYHAYPTVSMTCVSTHDSPTLTQWWRDYPKEVEAFCVFKGWKYLPDLTLQQRKEILWDSHHTTSLFHINLLQEYLALFPELIWPNPDDERINIPGKVLPANWTYRFKPSIETLTSHKGLQGEISQLLEDNISWKTAS